MSKINVAFEPNCTWQLKGGAFFCTHDQKEVVDYSNGPLRKWGYGCVECGELLGAFDEDDRQETLAEIKLMRTLGK